MFQVSPLLYKLILLSLCNTTFIVDERKSFKYVYAFKLAKISTDIIALIMMMKLMILMKCFWHFRHLFNPPRFPESIRDRRIRRDVLWDSKQKYWVHSHIWRTLQYKKWVCISYISCKNPECSKSIPAFWILCILYIAGM